MTDLEITRGSKRSTKFERSAPISEQIASRLRMFSQNENGCWEWTGAAANTGYGQVWLKGERFSAHRFFYENYIGEIPAGLTLDHLCRNRLCVNPKHLEPVSNKENILRGESPAALNSKKDKCVSGHSLFGDNLYVYRGKRMCKECRRKNTRKWRTK